DNGFLFVDVVFDDVERPLAVQRVVEPLNDRGALDVIDLIAERSFALLDLLWLERLFEQLPIHGGLLVFSDTCSQNCGNRSNLGREQKRRHDTSDVAGTAASRPFARTNVS